ncbi:MAG: hypothetical protein ACFNVH_00990, partial [Segatella maculosa]
ANNALVNNDFLSVFVVAIILTAGTCLFVWTHELCVPTCIRTAFPINHFTHQYGQYRYVGTHGSCVRSSRIEDQTRVCLGGRTSCASLHAFKLTINDLHLAFQSHPFYHAFSAILDANLNHITVQYG